MIARINQSQYILSSALNIPKLAVKVDEGCHTIVLSINETSIISTSIMGNKLIPGKTQLSHEH